ncbi:MAG: heavy metal-binding domain-containing protein [Thermoanaerobaculia bacterium]
MFGNHKRGFAAAFAGGLVIGLVALAGCGKDPSVASRSASAFREAQKKGATFEGTAGSHGHGALTPGGGQDHSGMEMGGEDPSGMAMEGKDHSGMAMGGKDHSGMAMKGKDRSGMDMGGMNHSGMAMGGKDHSGMAMKGKDHSGMAMGGMDHSGMAMGGKNPSGGPSAVGAPMAASPGQPARTLSSDPLDSPAASSVLDAQRSAAMAQEMSGGMSGMSGMSGMEGHGGGTYRQIDAGRGPGATEGSEKQTPGAGPHQHGQAAHAAEEGEHSHAPATGAAQEEAAVYTCPMHPEVTSTTPGKCPKCGMTLVKRSKG